MARGPTLLSLFVTVLVFTRRVQDTDANSPIGVHVGVPHLGLEGHQRGLKGKLWGELQTSLVATTWKAIWKTAN